MHYGNIKYCDIANGEGVRTSLFVSGCTHHCKNCFQPQTWDFSFGEEFTQETERAIIESLAPEYVDGLTVLGGEPMEPENQEVLAGFLARVKEIYPNKMIWVYTGDVFEDLNNEMSDRHTQHTNKLLNSIDVLVDGPFIEEKKNITLRFRGSENQRIIDLQKTLATGRVALWESDPLFATHAFE